MSYQSYQTASSPRTPAQTQFTPFHPQPILAYTLIHSTLPNKKKHRLGAFYEAYLRYMKHFSYGKYEALLRCMKRDPNGSHVFLPKILAKKIPAAKGGDLIDFS